MQKALHIKIRKILSKLIHVLLSKLFPLKENSQAIKNSEIKKILVVRINYRMGNILFTTPLLNALHKQFPHAHIDMMVGAPFTSSLIEGMPQINKVYSFPRKLLKQPLTILKLKKELQSNRYDLLVAPNLHSTSDTFFTFLVTAKYKVGFYAKNVFSPLTHAVISPSEIQHEALKPLALMSVFSHNSISHYDVHLDICLSKEEIESVSKDIKSQSIGIFRDARGDKKLSDNWWLKFVNAIQIINPNIHIIDVLDPNNTTPLKTDISTLSEKNLRILAAKIASFDAFICADTGPMHLASASKTPTIAFFKTTSPLYYGTLGKKDLSLVIKDMHMNTIIKKISTHLDIIPT